MNVGEKIIGGIILAIGTAGLALLGVLLGTLVGIVVGWVVGWFFTPTILGIFAALGVEGFAMWQIGAFMGFVGGFLKTSVTTNYGDGPCTKDL